MNILILVKVKLELLRYMLKCLGIYFIFDENIGF